jgi:FkbM family methyltransferase
MTVLEVGANIGVFTVPLARFVHPGGRVIAFEPQRIMYQMLCGNLALNAVDKSLRTTAQPAAAAAPSQSHLSITANPATSAPFRSRGRARGKSFRSSRSTPSLCPAVTL